MAFPLSVLVSVDIPKLISRQVASPLKYIDNEKPADVLLIGSSLILAPPLRLVVSHAEAKKRLIAGNLTFLSQPYWSALFDVFQRKFAVVNIGVSGAVATDQRTIVEAIMKSKVKPRLIIYACSPRDLIDNTMGKAPRESPVFRTFQFAQAYKISNKFDCQAILEREQRFLILVWKYVRSEVFAAASKFFERPSALWQASTTFKQQVADEDEDHYTAAQRIAIDVATYQNRYHPFRQDYFDFQLDSFCRILQECHKNSVPIIVINMPLADSNLEILGTQLRAKYKGAIQSACSVAKVELVDMQGRSGEPYEAVDFIDTCHLSRSGAIKFMKDFSVAMRNSVTMNNAFVLKSAKSNKGRELP